MSDYTELLKNLSEQQAAKAEALKDQFTGWSTPMLQARIQILEGWETIVAATWGDANYQPLVYGAAPYLDVEDTALDNVWDIEREITRRDKAGE
jgi:hypothetical protein